MRSTVWSLPLRFLSKTGVILSFGALPANLPDSSAIQALRGPPLWGTICHGWPTEGEARVYCRAAGLEFPEP